MVLHKSIRAKLKSNFTYSLARISYQILCTFYCCSTIYSVETQSEHAFSRIYREKIWGTNEQGEGSSGSGSTLKEGTPFIQFVQDFLNRHSIKSVLDVGCGDWVLSKNICWGDAFYLGIDVVKEIIERNRMRHEQEKIHFLHQDAIASSLPPADLLICKDMLQHLPLGSIHLLLAKFKGYRFCILVNDIGKKNNREIYFGGYRSLDLTAPPFSLHPIEVTNYVSGETVKQIILLKNE